MNMKNATILLILLLAVVGLMIGVYYTEVSDIEKSPENSEEMIFEDANGTIIITLGENESFIDGFFT